MATGRVPPDRPAPPPPALRPDEAGRFIGRAAELAALRSLAFAERQLTLLGPSGMGKTRCARRLAAEAVLPGGVRFVDLTVARDAREFLAAVAQALPVPLAGTTDDELARQLGGAIGALGPALLVLDNAEHVAGDAGPILEAWLAAAPGARFVATSVVRFGNGAEACFELPPLSVEDGVELYADRARRVDSGFDPAADRTAVEELVRRLDRVPLAIELAAARARVLRPRQLLGRLAEDRFGILRGPGTGRHASLLAAIRCSWELLLPAEALALARCSVFAGGFTLDAAERVLADGTSGAPPVVDLLEALRDKSFLQLDGGDPPRFRLLESIRDHARDQLERLGLAAATRRRHAEFYVGLAAGGIDGAPDTATLRVLAAEHDNLLAAHRCGEPALEALAALALAPVLALRGPPLSETGVLAAGVEAARRAGDPVGLARLLRAAALLEIRQGRHEQAGAMLDEARGLAAGAGATRVELHAAIEQGRLHVAGGALAAARSELTAGIDRARASGEPFLAAYARNLLGMVDEAQGRLEASVEGFEAALEGFRRFGNRRFEGVALMNLGVAHGGAGRLAEAATLFEQAVAAFREVADRAGEADALVNLANTHLTAGRLDDAEALLPVALGLERALGNRRAEAFALANLGLVAHERGELREARELLQDALARCRACGERVFHALYLPHFAAVEAALGLEPEARLHFAEARTALLELGDPALLEMLEVLENFLALDAGPDRNGALLASARARLDRPGGPRRSSELAIALRLLERAITNRTGAVRAPPPREAPVREDRRALELGPEATWFSVDAGDRVALGRRRALRRILRELADRRLSAPGVGVPVERLFSAGWPDDRALPTSATARVYVAIRELRALGLARLLLRQADGYLLDPAVPLHKSHDSAGFRKF